jgi:hypothetical protein
LRSAYVRTKSEIEYHDVLNARNLKDLKQLLKRWLESVVFYIYIVYREGKR